MKVKKFSSLAHMTWDNQAVFQWEKSDTFPVTIKHKFLGGDAPPDTLPKVQQILDKYTKSYDLLAMQDYTSLCQTGFTSLIQGGKEKSHALIIAPSRCQSATLLYFEQSQHLIQLCDYAVTEKEMTEIIDSRNPKVNIVKAHCDQFKNNLPSKYLASLIRMQQHKENPASAIRLETLTSIA